MLMYQCLLERDDESTTGWIEERAAKVGASVEVKEYDNEFWTVRKVYQPPMDQAMLQRKQVADRKQREASDI